MANQPQSCEFSPGCTHNEGVLSHKAPIAGGLCGPAVRDTNTYSTEDIAQGYTRNTDTNSNKGMVHTSMAGRLKRSNSISFIAEGKSTASKFQGNTLESQPLSGVRQIARLLNNSNRQSSQHSTQPNSSTNPEQTPVASCKNEAKGTSYEDILQKYMLSPPILISQIPVPSSLTP